MSANDKCGRCQAVTVAHHGIGYVCHRCGAPPAEGQLLRDGLPRAKACPFCGSGELDMPQSGGTDREVAAIHCEKCGTDGPIVSIKQKSQRRPVLPHHARAEWDANVLNAEREAIELWNKRPGEQAAAKAEREGIEAGVAIVGQRIEEAVAQAVANIPEQDIQRLATLLHKRYASQREG